MISDLPANVSAGSPVEITLIAQNGQNERVYSFEGFINVLVTTGTGTVTPNRVGPFGLFQPVADGIKMLIKEDIVPHRADKVVHPAADVVRTQRSDLGTHRTLTPARTKR